MVVFLYSKIFDLKLEEEEEEEEESMGEDNPEKDDVGLEFLAQKDNDSKSQV